MTALIGLDATATRIPFVDPPLLLGPVATASFTSQAAGALLDAVRGVVGPTLDGVHAGTFREARKLRATPHLVAFVFPDFSLVLVAHGRALPFALAAPVGTRDDHITDTLLGLDPLWTLMAQTPWVCAEPYTNGRAWPKGAIAPPWLPCTSWSYTYTDIVLDTVQALGVFATNATGKRAATIGLEPGTVGSRGVVTPAKLVGQNCPHAMAEALERIDLAQLLGGPLCALQTGPERPSMFTSLWILPPASAHVALTWHALLAQTCPPEPATA